MAKLYGDAGKVILDGLKGYVAEVTAGEFPQRDNWFTMRDSQFEELKKLLVES